MNQAELAKLEHAFAADPASEAYRPLAEAYLAMGRFMEAMVVCKKGVKAHPQSAEPRLLLARVYAAQGKDKKALEELTAALSVVPGDATLLRMAGDLAFKSGTPDAGKDYLLQAYQADATDGETLALLQKWKVAPEASKALGTSRDSGAPTVTAPRPAPEAVAVPSGPKSSPPTVTGKLPAAPPSEKLPAPVAAPRAPRPAPARPAPPIEELDSDILSEEVEVPARAYRTGRGGSKSTFFMLLFAMVTTLAVYAAWGRQQARNKRDLARLMNEVVSQLKHDHAAAYDKAIAAGKEALALDDDSPGTHAYLAYASTVRWGEHAGDDTVRTQAESHLKLALASEEPPPHALAAQALVALYTGKGGEGLKAFEEQVKGLEQKGKQSSLLANTLGLLRMNVGDMEGAKQAMETAQQLAPDDARTYSLLGTFYQRRGQALEARRHYDFALRFEPTHPEAAIGKAFVLLDSESPDDDYVTAAVLLKGLMQSQPPPSRRHLGAAQMLKSLLIARVGSDLSLYKDKNYARELSEKTGVGFNRERNRAESRTAEQAAFGEDRKNPELYLIKGRRLFHEEEYEAAAGQFRQAIQMDSMRAHFHVELARALMKKPGGEKEAEAALRKALGLMPESPKLRLMLGDSLFRQGKTREAIAEYERAIADPKTKNPEARLALGRLYRDLTRDLAKSAEQLQAATLEFGSQEAFVAQSNTELGLTYEALGEKDKAAEAYQRAMETDASLADPVFLLGRLMMQNPKEKRDAKRFFKEYLKMAPQGPYAASARDFL